MQSSEKIVEGSQSDSVDSHQCTAAGGNMSRSNRGSKLGKQVRVGLFVPCYIDMIFPEVGIATLQLLERFGLNVGYPMNQTCCGQPMSNSGDQANAAAAELLFVKNFAQFDYIVGPAGSCVKQIRCHFDGIEQTDAVKHVRERTYELVEFLHDVLEVDSFPWANFPHSHEAYRRVRLDRTAFGCFIAGPSATADVEATLVHGAQGPRTLNVLFLPSNEGISAA